MPGSFFLISHPLCQCSHIHDVVRLAPDERAGDLFSLLSVLQRAADCEAHGENFGLCQAERRDALKLVPCVERLADLE